MSEEEGNNRVPDALTAFQEIYSSEMVKGDAGLLQGLVNLGSLPEFDLQNGVPQPVPGQGPVKGGVIGFRRIGGQMHLAIACDTATVRYVPLAKFIALIEHLHDERSANVVLQNYKLGDDGRGQILARVNPAHSAIHVAEGVVGRAIKQARDIVANEVYYLKRSDLASYYLASKRQISTENQLDSMIAAYDGWKGYSIPLDPLNPVDA